MLAILYADEQYLIKLVRNKFEFPFPKWVWAFIAFLGIILQDEGSKLLVDRFYI